MDDAHQRRNTPLSQMMSRQTHVESRNDVEETLTSLLETAHNGIRGAFIAIEAIMKIQERNLWKDILNENGNPRYRTFEDFLKDEFKFERSYFCQLRNGYQAYKNMEEIIGNSHPSLLETMKQNATACYEISKIPKWQLEELLKELVTDSDNNIPITRSRIAQWRKRHCPINRTTAHGVIDEVSSSNRSAGSETAEDNVTETTAVGGEEHVTGNLPVVVSPTPVGSQELSNTIINIQNNEVEHDDHDNEEEDNDDKEDTPYKKGRRKFDHIYKLLSDIDLIEYMAKDLDTLKSLDDRFQEVKERMQEYISDDDQS